MFQRFAASITLRVNIHRLVQAEILGEIPGPEPRCRSQTPAAPSLRSRVNSCLIHFQSLTTQRLGPDFIRASGGIQMKIESCARCARVNAR